MNRMYADNKQTATADKTTIISEYFALLEKNFFPSKHKKEEPVAKFLCIVMFGGILTI
jgi:hypothetical protein